MAKKRGAGGRFAKGQSGNPTGRPKTELCLTSLLRAALATRDKDGKRTKAQAVIDSLITVACEGDSRAIQTLFNRVDGVLVPTVQGPTQSLEEIAQVMKEKRDRLSGNDS